MNCFDCKTPCEYSNPLGECIKEKVVIPHDPPEKDNQTNGVQDLINEMSLLRLAAKALVATVERYVEPKPGDKYCSRNEVLMAKNNLKKLLNDEK